MHLIYVVRLSLSYFLVMARRVLIAMLVINLGSDCKSDGNTDEYLSSLVKVVEKNFAIWTKNRSKDSLRNAIKAQRKILQMLPQDFEVSYSLANLVYMQSTEDHDARMLAQQAANIRPNSAKALKLLGRIHVQLGDSMQGLPYLLRSIALFPNDPECWYKVGAVFYENGDMWKAATCFKTAAHISGDAFYTLSAAHTLNKLSQSSAFSFYWAAVRADPNLLDAWNDLTFALSEKRSFRLAEITAIKAFNIQPTAVSLFTVANSIMSQGSYDRAVISYEQAVMMQPDNMDILHNLAFTLLLADRPVPAVKASLRAVDVLLRGKGTTTDPSGVPSLGPTFVVGLANALRRVSVLYPASSDIATHLEQLAVAVLAPLRQPPAPRNEVPSQRTQQDATNRNAVIPIRFSVAGQKVADYSIGRHAGLRSRVAVELIKA